MEPKQQLRSFQVQLALSICTAVAVCAAAGAPNAASAQEVCSLAVQLAPGQAVAFDGTYQLQIPSGKESRGLVLARIDFGLTLEAVSSDAQGVTIEAGYDRFESYLRNKPADAGRSPRPAGSGFRFLLTPRGQIQSVPGGKPAAGEPALSAFWPGWPVGQAAVGQEWTVEGRSGSAGIVRHYRLCEITGDGDRRAAVLSYTEQGTVEDAPVSLPDGQARLRGTILGVGEVRLDLATGLPARAASVSNLTGTVARGGEAAGSVRLESEAVTVMRADAR